MIVGTATAVGTIVDDDWVTVSVAPASATEGSPVEFKVTLSKAVASNVVVTFATADDDTPGARQATAGTDYQGLGTTATVLAGQKESAAISVTTLTDDDVEGPETFKVRISERSGQEALPTGVRISTATAVGTIVDDDATTVSVESASATEGSALSFTVRLSAVVSSNVVLGWSTGDDDTSGANQATSGTDYTAVTSGSATITAGETTATLTVQTTADTTAEPDETFKVTITGTTLPAGVIISTTTAVGTIEDDDGTKVSVEAASATEGSALSFTVRLSAAVSSNVVLGWSTGDDDTSGANQATSGTDYTAVTNGSATITAGQTTATLTVQTTADATAESDETFKVTITGTTLPAGVIIKTATAVGTIREDTSVKVSIAAVSEGGIPEGRQLGFLVRLSAVASSDVVLGWSTGDDDTEGANQATSGTDYTAVTNGSVTITAGSTASRIDVQTTQDTSAESDETFKVTITGTTLPAGVTISTATAVGTITDDDVGVSIEDGSATEGSAVSFTVRLTRAAPTGGVSVQFSTGDDDTAGANQATSGTDYTASTSAITVKEGQTTADFGISTTDDSVAEGDETFKVTITGTSPTGFDILDSTAVGTIVDNDASGNDDGTRVSVEAASATEGSALSFTARLSEAVSSDVVLGWSTGDDDTSGANQATSGTDYTAVASGRATIAAGQTTATLTVQTTADTAAEGDETLKVTMTAIDLPTGVEVGSTSAVGTIVDDDGVTVSVEAASATEGSALSFTVRLLKAVSSNVVLGWSTGADDTSGANQATSGTDYTAVTSGSATIAAGQTTATLTVQTTADSTLESDETLKVTITGTTLPDGVTIGTSAAVGTIVDDDTVTVSVEPASTYEGSRSKLSFPVRLSKPASSNVVLGWSTGADDTSGANQATSGTDYTAVTNGSLTITAGRTLDFLVVSTTVDSAVEGDETLKVTITGTTLPAGVVIRTATAVGTIRDDDVATVSVRADSATEGSPLSFPVRLSKPVSSDVVLGWSTVADDTAGARRATSGTDYQAMTSGSVTIAAGQTAATLTVQTTANSAADGDETFKVTITGTTLPTGVVVQAATAVGTIEDDDVNAAVSVESASATEGSALSFTVRLSAPASSNVVLGWSTGADRTSGANQATSGTDYTAVTSGSATITAGQTTATLTVQTTADTTAEGDETFKVTITGTTLPAGVVIQTARAVGTIEDDDVTKVSVEDTSIVEGTTLSFTVRLSRVASADVVVVLSTGADDTPGANQATENVDYLRSRPRVTISAGATEKIVMVDTYADAHLEGDETFKATLIAVTLPAGVVIQTATAVGTITDNTIGVSLEQGNFGAFESTGYTDMVVRLSRPALEAMVVSLSTGDDDTPGANQATAGTDYTAVTNGAVTIPFGGTKGEYRVVVKEDSEPEGIETFKVTMTSTGLPANAGFTNTNVIAKIHDDENVRLVVDRASAFEGVPVEFTARLTQSIDSTVSVAMYTEWGGEGRLATVGTDYRGTRIAATIPAGKTESNVMSVRTLADNDVEGDETFLVVVEERSGENALPDGVTLANERVVGTIMDAAATVLVGAASAAEGSALSFPVRLSKAVSSNVVLGWSTGDDTAGARQATSGTDYTAVTSGSATITAGQTTATLTVQTTADSDVEGDETFKVTITGTSLPAGAVICSSSSLPAIDCASDSAEVVGTILDDDGTKVSVESASATEGSALSFTVRLSETVSSNVVLGWSTGDDDTEGAIQATSGTDYTAVTGGSVTIAAGQTTATLTVQTTDDTTAESDETFKVTITATTLPAGVIINTATAVGTIEDDDGTPPPPSPPPSPPGGNRPPVVSALCEPCVVAPGGELTLTATASDPDDDGLTYAWSATSGSFVGAADGATVRWTAPEAVERVTISVEVSDGQGGAASATVTIEVTNQPPNEPPAFESSEYGFELLENADGSRTPVDVGAVAAADPEGDELIYEVASGDRARFTVGARDGVVRYVGAGEDFESGPTRFELAVRARDPHDAEAEALVVVTVIDVNEPPEAMDDEAATDEDQAVTIDVLANDTDPDGDGLQVESVSVPAHGTAVVARGGVLYTPEASYHGADGFTYVVSDGNGGTATAAVAVTVLPVNEPPAFESSEYGFELQENADGSRTALDLGAVAATDPDGDELIYEMASGDGSRFTVGARGGAVRYVGAGEDFESGPTRFELAVRARDPHDAEAEALVVVTVIDVNEPPEAMDDEAATDEDQAVTIDVLANDTDPDGDGLQVESVSDPAHGTAVVARGGVLYTPTANYHGMDRFTYVVADGNGERSEAAVEVTVAPVNDAPAAVGVIPDQVLDEGGGEKTVELGPFFEDADGDALEYRVSSSAPSVVAVSVAGAAVVLSPAAYGSAVVTVTAEDAGGLTATQAFSVGVSDRLAREAVADTLAGMARSHLASARMMLGRRVTANPTEASRMTVLGRTVPLGKAAARVQAEQMLAGWLSAVLTHRGPGATPGLGAPAGSGFGAPAIGPAAAIGSAAAIGPAAARGLPGAGGGFGALAPGAGAGLGSGLGARGPGVASAATMPAASTGMGAPGAVGHGGVPRGLGEPWGLGGIGGGFGRGGDPLRGSEFLLALGGRQDGEEASRPGRRWQVWGQGDVQTFQGAPSDAAGYDGQLRTTYLGVDTWLTDRWMAGMAVARSIGDGDWRAGGTRGALETTLTAVHPYVQWSDRTTSVWATAGGGWGVAENVRASGRKGESDLGLRLGLVELRRGLGSAGGVQFGVRGDAAWAELRTAGGGETIDGQTVAVHQARVGADVSRPVRLGGLTLAPFTEVHVRRDGGAGQRGEGVEVAGGLRATAGKVRVDAQGRLLVVHSAEGYRERGVGLTLSVGDQDQEGLSLSVSPRWGDSAAGAGALWQEQVYGRHAPAAADAWEVDARGGYGLRLPGGRLLNWFGSLTHSPYGRGFLIGGQVGALD